jgi:hypothetical protein
MPIEQPCKLPLLLPLPLTRPPPTRNRRRNRPRPLLVINKMPTFIELEAKSGYLSGKQKDVRAELLRVGCAYWVAMSARAAMAAVVASGIELRRPWRGAPAPWEGPFPDTVRIPRAPEVLEQRREERRRARERKRARVFDAARQSAPSENSAGSEGGDLWIARTTDAER